MSILIILFRWLIYIDIWKAGCTCHNVLIKYKSNTLKQFPSLKATFMSTMVNIFLNNINIILGFYVCQGYDQ